MNGVKKKVVLRDAMSLNKQLKRHHTVHRNKHTRTHILHIIVDTYMIHKGGPVSLVQSTVITSDRGKDIVHPVALNDR